VTPRFGKTPPAAPEPGPAAIQDTALKPLDDETAGPRVPMLGKMALDSILAELVAAMQECRRLYLSFVPPSQGYPKPASRQFSLSQDRLHRGLLAKVYATISKQELRELADWAAFQCQRRQAGLPHEMPDLRFLFLGPAGTGKTYVARLLSELLFASGVLKHGHLVEVDGFDLTSREPRDAARLMKDKIRQAIGGTLLIDCSGALMSAGESPDGIAIRALRENLVAHAGRFAVVLADRSDRLPYQLGRQPRLAQLFQRTWQFGTYRAGELGQIFQCCCDRSRYRVTRPAQIKLLLGLHWQLRQDADRFGYGHGVLRVFERAVHRLASRIAGLSPLTKDLLTTFHDSDIVIDGVPAQVFKDLADPRRSFSISCPGCAAVTLVGPDSLGIRVECRRCHHRFTSAWGEPVG